MGRSHVKYLLDSVILIDHFNDIEAATNFLSDHGSVCAVSVITRAEVLTGFQPRAEALARDLLNAFDAFPITVDIADHAAQLRRQAGWKLPDALQAAVAAHHGLTLVTRNTRDFQKNEWVDVLVPYRLSGQSS